MKKSSKSPLKKRSCDISLQHKNEASYKFSKKKKNLLHSAEKRAGVERVNFRPLNGKWYASVPVWSLRICHEAVLNGLPSKFSLTIIIFFHFEDPFDRKWECLHSIGTLIGDCFS